MFTGIIEQVAEVVLQKMDNEILTLTIKKPEDWKLHIGQSIAVNGVCLTVTEFDDTSFRVELMPETTKRSIFGKKIPKTVNLENAMSPDGLFEGHIVQGHVDELSTITDIEENPQWRVVTIAYPKEKAGLLVQKGSITVDGTSLTISDLTDETFSVSLIPHTLEHTTLGDRKVGDHVNIEYDILSKLVERQLEIRKPK